ncbi:MAG: PAS domain-containing protein [Agarilytica sp.]
MNVPVSAQTKRPPHTFGSATSDAQAYIQMKTRFELAFAGASVGVWDWLDLNKDEAYWSPKFFQLLGYEDQEITPSKQAFKHLLHPEDRPRAKQALDQHLQDNRPFDIEYRLKTKQGEYRWFRGCGSTSLEENNQTRRMVGTLQDIHTQKLHEDELETLVVKLKQSNNDLERFAHVASHDLQEPLRVISSYVQLINKRYNDKLGDGAKEFFGFIVDGCKRMQQLINDLLDFSRVVQNDLVTSRVDLKDTMKHVERNLAKKMESSAAIITHKDLPSVIANRSLLERLLQNLINNSLKYQDTSTPPVIEITTKEEDHEWVISVKDNGIGIDEKYFDKIFIIFQRLHTVDEYSGTGVGLAICQRIVHAHGGRVWVESILGEGTTFSFTLPKTSNSESQVIRT